MKTQYQKTIEDRTFSGRATNYVGIRMFIFLITTCLVLVVLIPFKLEKPDMFAISGLIGFLNTIFLSLFL